MSSDRVLRDKSSFATFFSYNLQIVNVLHFSYIFCILTHLLYALVKVSGIAPIKFRSTTARTKMLSLFENLFKLQLGNVEEIRYKIASIAILKKEILQYFLISISCQPGYVILQGSTRYIPFYNHIIHIVIISYERTFKDNLRLRNNSCNYQINFFVLFVSRKKTATIFEYVHKQEN